MAFLVAGVWSGVVGTSTTEATGEVVVGWRGVLYDLPGSLLMLGVAVTSLVFAARARRGRARGAGWGLWLSGGGLLLTLVVIGTTSADTVTIPHSATVNYALLPAEVAIAAVSVFLARRWARTPES